MMCPSTGCKHENEKMFQKDKLTAKKNCVLNKQQKPHVLNTERRIVFSVWTTKQR